MDSLVIYLLPNQNFNMKNFKTYEAYIVNEGKRMSLKIDGDKIKLSADSVDYDGYLNNDGEVEFTEVQDDGTIFDKWNWKDILGRKHAFVQLSKKIPAKVKAEGDYVKITVNFDDLKYSSGLLK